MLNKHYVIFSNYVHIKYIKMKMHASVIYYSV